MLLKNFIHLRTYSPYSLSEGALRIEETISLCHKYNMPAVAITDRNNLFGSLEFSQKVSSSGVQPIIGLLASFRLEGMEYSSIKSNIILLVKNETGYSNILEMTNRIYSYISEREENYLSLDDLKELNEGLILLTGGAEGPAGQLILNKEEEKAEALLVQLDEIFKNNIYIELYRHGSEDENITEPYFLKYALKYNIPIVATNKVYFSDMSMYNAHDALLCIASSAYLDETDRVKSNKEFYFKSSREMNSLFIDLPEALENTFVIAKRCAFIPQLRNPILPHYECSSSNTEEEELRFLSYNGLEQRLSKSILNNAEDDSKKKEEIKKIYYERLEYELGIIINMKFTGYFLIVSDFIRWGKRNNIPVGPGRGSGAGSMVAWALEITDLNPIQFNLIFERFLNPERISMPDFDIDFCQEKRDEIIAYVQKRYGSDKVAQIITFGKLQAKAVIRDIGRVMNMPYNKFDQISKMIPFNAVKSVTLQEAIDSDSRLKHMKNNDTEVSKLLSVALKLEGLYRHASTHAAGIVIADRPVQELVPVYRDNKSDMIVSGYSMKYTEKAGLVKFDFLGLKTLTVISKICLLLKEKNIDLDIRDIPLDDSQTFDLLVQGDTLGVFQLESTGMKDSIRRLKPDNIEDIIALISLYRPGPMDNIPSYIARKHGNEEIDYIDPLIKEVLEETYGVIIYQEQVMKIAQLMGGYTLAAADLLRRAMGKKNLEEMNMQRKNFILGAINNDVSEDKATYVFDLVAKFAGYGFNKSHAAAYAMISYQTAYLKAHYLIEFYISSMNLDINNPDKILLFFQDIKKHGIEILKPCVNKSQVFFSSEKVQDGKYAIRWALGAIKNSSISSAQDLVIEREKNGLFKNMLDFVSRVKYKILNKRQMEASVKAGVFDVFDDNRNFIFGNLEMFLSYGHRVSMDKESTQVSLFDKKSESKNIRIKNFKRWNSLDSLKYEFEAFGFYIGKHPMDAYKYLLTKERILLADDLENTSKGEKKIRIAGVITLAKIKSSPKGKFLVLVISDPTGIFEVSIFDEKILDNSFDILKEGSMVLMNVKIKKDIGGIRITVIDVQNLLNYLNNIKVKLCININDSNIANLTELKELFLSEKEGEIKVFLNVSLEKNMVAISLGESYNASVYMLNTVSDLFGSDVYFY